MAIEIDRLLLGDDTKSVRGKSIGRWCWPILSSNRSRITEPIENVWAKGWDALATLWKRYLPRSVWPRAEIRRPTAQRDGRTCRRFEYPAVNAAIARFEKRLKIDRELQQKDQEGSQRIEY